jgi:hypothetical protein
MKRSRALSAAGPGTMTLARRPAKYLVMLEILPKENPVWRLAHSG